jgi:hypothetical protein
MDVAMLHRIEMNIIEAPREILFAAHGVLP